MIMTRKILALFCFFIMCTLLSAQEIQRVQRLELKEGTLYLYDNGEPFKVITDRVLIKPKKSNEDIRSKYEILFEHYWGYLDIKVPEGINVVSFVENLKKSGEYESVDYITESKLAASISSVQDTELRRWHLSRVNAIDAWNITMGSPTVMVGVIDTGIDRGHYDIGYGNDGYTNVSYSLGYDYKNNISYQTPLHEHGTTVAGVLGAKTNNNYGVAGVSGGNGTAGITMISYCVKNQKNDPAVGVGDAIINATNNGAKIINISLSLTYNAYINEAIGYAYNNDVTIVCSTGNNNSSSISYPASDSRTIAVGATNKNDCRWVESGTSEGSNYGNGLNIVAPGDMTYTTKLSNSYNYYSGTSLAAPIITGTVALMLSVNPSLTPLQIKTILQNTAKKLSGYTYDSNGWNSEVGYGMLNTYAAVCTAKVSLTGPSIICNSGSFSISEIPTGASVSWSVSNNCLSIASGQGTSSVTLQKVSSGICDVSVNFSVGGQILCTLTKKDVVVGTPDLGMSIQFKTATGDNGCWASNMNGNTFTLENDLSWAYDRVEAQLYRLDNNLNPSTLVNSWSNISTTNASIPGYSAGWYLFKLRGVNDCGYSNWLEQEVEMVDFSMLNFLLNYDSASEMLTLTLIEPDAENSTQQVLRGAYEIELWNGLTTTKVRSYRTDLAKYEMSLAGLPSGIYIVRVIIDGKTYSKKFVKK